jgi:hypothetical protein
MMKEQIEEYLGQRVAVYMSQGQIHVGYLQRSKMALHFETVTSPSHPEVESRHELFTPWGVDRIEVLTEEAEQRLRASCTCTGELDHSWVSCPLHGPKGEGFSDAPQ